jgi:hypothetical protein
MDRSRISFQIDERFIETARNESKRRRDLSRKEQVKGSNEFEEEFQKLGLTSDYERSVIVMKKRIVRKLVRS